jgi:hypothetical protein
MGHAFQRPSGSGSSSENDDAIAVVNREWSEDQAVDHAEDGCVDTNAECERQNESCNESGARPERSSRIPEIASDVGEKPPDSGKPATADSHAGRLRQQVDPHPCWCDVNTKDMMDP